MQGNIPLTPVKAVRGFYIFSNDLASLIEELIIDAEANKKRIAVIGNPEFKKLEGVLLGLRGIKEICFRIEKYGDLIPLPNPKENGGDKPNVSTEGDDDTPKLILPT